MPVELVNKDPRYSKVHLIDPAPLGYLHLAAEVQAAHRPGPVLRRSRDKQQLFGVLKWQARQLAGLDAVERVTVYDAVVFAPPWGDVKDRPATLPAAWFDVAVLAETSSPETARQVRAAPAWQALAAALTERARRVHQVAARNAPGRRCGQDLPRPVPVQLFRRRRPCPGRRGVGLPSRLV
jgi:predicted component of type VI protein secretion system